MIQFFKMPVNLRGTVYVAMVPLFASRVAADCCTTVTLCILLYRTRPSFKSTMRLVTTLIIYAINRFILTTIVVIVQTIILLAQPDSIWAMTIEFVTVHLYVNSFLAALNSRNHLREIESPGQHISALQSISVGKEEIKNDTKNITGTTSDRGLIPAHNVDPYGSNFLEAKPQFETWKLIECHADAEVNGNYPLSSEV